MSDADKDHSECDCFAMAVLSHGDEGQVFGTDGDMQIKKLIEPLKRCETLYGKPKLFFVQVCVCLHRAPSRKPLRLAYDSLRLASRLAVVSMAAA